MKGYKNDDNKIRSCPFCGNPRVLLRNIEYDKTLWIIECNICHSEFTVKRRNALRKQDNMNRVVEGWNRRKLMNWINVKDKLPECGAYVLVCCTMKVTSKIDYVNAVTMAFVCEEGFVDVELDEVITEGVTHWMPLPQLPEEEEK